MPEGTISPPATRTPPPPPPSGGGLSGGGGGGTDIGGWIRQHKWLTAGIGLAAAVGVYLYSRSRSASAASSAGGASTNATTGSGSTPDVYALSPGEQVGWQGSGAYGQSDLSQTLQEIEQELSGKTTAQNTVANQSGYGQEIINGVTYDILGIESQSGAQGYSGYNVGGGAPVFYYEQGHNPAQGGQEAVPGAYVLTPAIYGNQISSNPTHTPH